ncbi:unnamed protein product [Linum trigynum]|uniref:Reverse transcriptase RNase H-like domain-containing protein n=1 Tax=Linum trigynum TaxID=586398 RepID=A0AAV2FR44_9ROSI
MTAIFGNLVEDAVEVFMDDFSVYVDSFHHCLTNLENVLIRCEETHLALNWEKRHFMVTEGIVLGHKISNKGIEVDRAKIETIAALPPPSSVKAIRSFLGHAGFYRCFIKDFSKISQPLTKLLEKDAVFSFYEKFLLAFKLLKEKLTNSPILMFPDWNLPFELMCDASDYAVGTVLGQRKEKRFHPIYYASRTLNDAQRNYTTTEKEMLAIVFAFDKFRSYLVLSHTVVFTDHHSLRYLLSKADAKPRLIRWILLLQEFDIEIKDKKGVTNVAADHLSRLEGAEFAISDPVEINESFPDELLEVIIKEAEGPWFADMANYLAVGRLPQHLSYQAKKKLFADLKHYFWDDPFLFRIGSDGIIHRCVPITEAHNIIHHCHSGQAGGHYSGNRTTRKVLESGFYWPTIF